LASDRFDESDYIRDYESFISYVQEYKPVLTE